MSLVQMPSPRDGLFGASRPGARQNKGRYQGLEDDYGASRLQAVSGFSDASGRYPPSRVNRISASRAGRNGAPSRSADPVSPSGFMTNEHYDGSGNSETRAGTGRSDRITSTSQSRRTPRSQEAGSRSYATEHAGHQANYEGAWHSDDASGAGTASIPTSFGGSLRQRIAVAVGSLSLNVGLSLDTNTATGDGERTPAGVESRITVALKEYYLARAQSGADLPDWLFSADERLAAGGARNAATSRALRDDMSAIHTRPPRSSPPPSPDKPRRGYYNTEDRRGNESGYTAVSSRFREKRNAKRGVDILAKQNVASCSEPTTERASAPTFGTAPANGESNLNSRRTPERPRGIGGGLPSGPGGMRGPMASRR